MLASYDAIYSLIKCKPDYLHKSVLIPFTWTVKKLFLCRHLYFSLRHCWGTYHHPSITIVIHYHHHPYQEGIREGCNNEPKTEDKSLLFLCFCFHLRRKKTKTRKQTKATAPPKEKAAQDVLLPLGRIRVWQPAKSQSDCLVFVKKEQCKLIQMKTKKRSVH